jgi:predicted NAD/FAD-dependent oxidoreductase
MTILIVSAVLLSMVYLSRALSAKSLARDFGRSTKKLRVAVIGAGVASCSAANTLATFQNDDGDFPFHVSLFDSGRGAGGRCSTRRSKQDGVDLQFDHGAVYIGKPKTEEFSATLEDWKESGAVKEWIGSFADLRFKNTFGSFVRGADTGRYVGVPTMSEICKSMLDPYENIEQYYQSTVKPLVVSGDNHRGRWKIVTEKDGEGEEVGDAYDWVVIGDKKEVTSELLGSSSSLVQQMPFKSAPVLAVMAAFSTDEVLRKFPYDGVRLDGHPVLGWMSRETSKPWRERTDGKELWLLQSTVDFAQHIIQ